MFAITSSYRRKGGRQDAPASTDCRGHHTHDGTLRLPGGTPRPWTRAVMEALPRLLPRFPDLGAARLNPGALPERKRLERRA